MLYGDVQDSISGESQVTGRGLEIMLGNLARNVSVDNSSEYEL